MQKILVTGSNGLLGQTLVNLLSKKPGYTIIGFAKGAKRNTGNDQYKHVDIDLVDFQKVHQLLREVRPHFIVNCAAMTNVDLCETTQEACDLINVSLVEELTRYCCDFGVHLIQISTDFIFDGKDGPYKENDLAKPINYYGLSKLKAEQSLLKADINYTVLRTILVFGRVEGMTRNNIVLWIKESVAAGQTLTIVNDQFRMPTYVVDLAEACWQSIAQKMTGIFHISSSELLSIYQMALQVCEVFELDPQAIKAISTGQLNQVANRPPSTGFDLQNSRKFFNINFEPFKKRLLAFKKVMDCEV